MIHGKKRTDPQLPLGKKRTDPKLPKNILILQKYYKNIKFILQNMNIVDFNEKKS